jgi:hypothetical protein
VKSGRFVEDVRVSKTGVPSNVGLVVGLFAVPIAVCEWRLRKMGFLLKRDCIVLIRALNSTRIPWREIDSFALVAPGGWIDYDNRRVGVKRHRNRLIAPVTIKLPTVWVSCRPRGRWVPPFGPSGLKWSGGEIADVIGLLNDQLAAHRDSAQAPGPFARARS